MRFFLPILMVALVGGLIPSCQFPMPMTVLKVRMTGGIVEQLETARQAWKTMGGKSRRSLSSRRARERYDIAVVVVVVVRSLATSEGTPAWGKTFNVGGGNSWRIHLDPHSENPLPSTYSLAGFGRCEVVSDLTLSGFHKIVEKQGVGVPVVLRQEDSNRARQPFHPPEGEFLSTTAVLEFPDGPSDGPAEARLRFYNPMKVSLIPVGGNTLPMVEKLTGVLGLSLTNRMADGDPPRLSAESSPGEEDARLFFLSRYDREKIPVVFVHGLLCGPDVWKNAVNAIYAVPELRRRYQPACFMYPRGLPIPTTAALLRRSLSQARETLDPGHRDAGFGQVVLVGHSMGGLVSRMQTIDSGDSFWKAYFATSPRNVTRRIDSKTRRMLMDAMYFKREPDVDRVIFICTPHRGSRLADVGIYRTVLRLVLFLPKTAKKTLEELADLPLSFVQPELREFSDGAWSERRIYQPRIRFSRH
jgi:triacylglycerol esterase/lipase EstA (alpha/beta hydrolase family)